jgi:hypothetical protein
MSNDKDLIIPMEKLSKKMKKGGNISYVNLTKK